MRDTFLTISYKGFFTQSCRDIATGKEIVTAQGTKASSMVPVGDATDKGGENG